MARVFSLSGRLKTLFDVLAFSFSLVAMSSSRIVTLSWPEAAAHPPVFPVFLPFSGCPVRCVFCAQDRQTGCAPRQAADALAVAGRQLRERAGRAHPAPELAFYGGTFTALPPEDFAACLIFARMARHEGLICGLRCSTRPDRLATDRLAALREAGCACVELGVHSFADDALRQSRRGYDGETARAACAAVRAAGMRVGVQLMPGMPGSRPARFLEDVRLALELGAACLRFYPCLVLEGTELIKEVSVSLSKVDHVSVHPAADVELLLPNGTDPASLERRLELESPAEAPISTGQTLGTLSLLTADGEVLATVDLLASNDVEASGLLVFLRNVREFFGSTAVKVVGIVLLVLIAALVIWKVTVGRRRYRYGRSVSRRSRGGGYRGRRR